MPTRLLRAVFLSSLVWATLTASWLATPRSVLSQTGPLTAAPTVTAQVPDNAPPTTPILISPSNGAILTISNPTFIWEASTDEQGISHYQFFLDGVIVFSNLPTSTTTTPEYELTFNNSTQRYELLGDDPIAEGSHTWKIRAVDSTGNTTDSATWSFTIDTTAPVFVITQFGPENVSISAQDASTIPSTPIELDDNTPTLSGSGEANSAIQVTVSIPGDPNQQVLSTISAGGSWSLVLPLVPRDTIITLNFVITDLAGNISVLNGVQYVVNTAVIVFPPVSPSPSLDPTQPTPPPSSPAPSPLITIPLLPPDEVAQAVVNQITELIPGPIGAVVNALPEEIREAVTTTIEDLAPVSAAVVTAAIPIASAVAVASQFSWGLSPDIFIKILQAIGLIPVGKARGLVFDSYSYEPVPFALLTITGKSQDGSSVTETVVSDVDGIYKGVKLPPGSYQITVSHQDYLFPTQKVRPSYLRLDDYYRGERFTVRSSQEEQLFLIPVDMKSASRKRSWRTRLRLLIVGLSRRSLSISLPLFVISGILASLFPTLLNLVFFGMYTAMLGMRARLWFRTPIVSGVVIDDTGQKLAHAVIRLTQPETNELIGLVVTADNGEFALYGQPGVYQLSIVKEGYIWMDQGSALSFYEVNTTATPQQVVATMSSVRLLYQDLFGEATA